MELPVQSQRSCRHATGHLLSTKVLPSQDGPPHGDPCGRPRQPSEPEIYNGYDLIRQRASTQIPWLLYLCLGGRAVQAADLANEPQASDNELTLCREALQPLLKGPRRCQPGASRHLFLGRPVQRDVFDALSAQHSVNILDPHAVPYARSFFASRWAVARKNEDLNRHLYALRDTNQRPTLHT